MRCGESNKEEEVKGEMKMRESKVMFLLTVMQGNKVKLLF